MYITYRANHYMQALYGAQMLNTPLAHIEVGKDGAVHVSARHSTHDDLNTLMKDSYVQPELVHPLIQDESAVREHLRRSSYIAFAARGGGAGASFSYSLAKKSSVSRSMVRLVSGDDAPQPPQVEQAPAVEVGGVMGRV